MSDYRTSKKIIYLVAVLVIIMALVLGCGPKPEPSEPTAKPEPTPEPKKEYVIRYSHGLPSQHYVAAAQEEWAARVTERTAGQVKFEVYPSAQLYNDRDLVQALASGAVEAGGLYSYILAPAVPLWEIFSVPGCADTSEQVEGILEGEMRAQLFAPLEEMGLKPIFVMPWGAGGDVAGYAGTGTQIIVLADQKGKKIRTISKPHAEIIETGGGQAVFLSGAELYTGMQRGTLDTLSVTTAHLIERNLSEVTEWFTGNVPVGSDMMSVITINKKFFDGLPADLQKVILDVGEEVYQESKRKGVEGNTAYLKDVKDRGIKVYLLSSEERAVWLETVGPIVGDYFTALGPDAVALYNQTQEQNRELGLPSNPID